MAESTARMIGATDEEQASDTQHEETWLAAVTGFSTWKKTIEQKGRNKKGVDDKNMYKIKNGKRKKWKEEIRC